jgi:predicted amidophosphoribosyltransferase
MAGYGVHERKLDATRVTKANPHQCGSCGNRVPQHETLCQQCKDDVLYKFESGESQ